MLNTLTSQLGTYIANVKLLFCLCFLPCCCYSLLSNVQLCNPVDSSTPGFLVLHHLPEFTQLMTIESVLPSNHLILYRPLLLLPSIFPNIRVFFKKLALSIKWPKNWSFSFSISPSDEYSGLISFRIVNGLIKN